ACAIDKMSDEEKAMLLDSLNREK
nr:XRE family transcriptional regulator [Vibrio anguillarum]